MQVPPPLVSTLVCTDVGQHCLISSSHFVGVCLEWGHPNVSFLSLQASRHPLFAWTLFYHRFQSDQLSKLLHHKYIYCSSCLGLKRGKTCSCSSNINVTPSSTLMPSPSCAHLFVQSRHTYIYIYT